MDQNIEKLRQDVDEDKAKAYADEGAAGLIDPHIAEKKEKLFDKLGSHFTGLTHELTDLEKEDIKIQKARLQMEKEKELRSAEADIDEQIDKEAMYKLNALEQEQARFREQLKFAKDPMEQKRLLNELE